MNVVEEKNSKAAVNLGLSSIEMDVEGEDVPYLSQQASLAGALQTPPVFEGNIDPEEKRWRQSGDLLARKIIDLEGLSDGWLNGEGIAPAATNLLRLFIEMATSWPKPLADYVPAVLPTEEGNVTFSWMLPNACIELEVNFTGLKLELYATNTAANTFVEEYYEANE